MDIYERGEMHSFGKTEDGEDFTGNVIKIIAESPNGSRWEYKEAFPTIEPCEVDMVDGEEFYGTRTDFVDISDEAHAKAERVISDIKESLAAGQSLNMDDWHEIAPAYGSHSHAQMGDALLYDEEESRHYQGMRF